MWIAVGIAVLIAITLFLVISGAADERWHDEMYMDIDSRLTRIEEILEIRDEDERGDRYC